MTLLAILYWVILILALIGAFVPNDYWPRAYIGNVAWIVLFVIIGLKIFRTPLQ